MTTETRTRQALLAFLSMAVLLTALNVVVAEDRSTTLFSSAGACLVALRVLVVAHQRWARRPGSNS